MRASAEALPFADHSFDAAMAVLSNHHWTDQPAGLRELRRVAHRVVLFTFDVAYADAGWITEYLPGFRRLKGLRLDQIIEGLGGASVERVPVPHDCADGFLSAYWRRPEAYLDPRVRAGISVFAQLEPAEVERCVAHLAADLQSGAWHARHADVLDLEELDLGYRLLVAPATAARSSPAA